MAGISVVIPVYNAEACLAELYARLVRTLEPITSDFQILLVEDASADKSWERIAELAARDKRVHGLRFSRNFGQHHGIAAGLDHCDGDWVVIMDCDLQDPPEAIPALLAKAEEGYDVVLARRAVDVERRHRRLLVRLFARVFQALTGAEYDDRVGAFRLLSRRVVLAYRQFGEKSRLLGGAIEWLGFPKARVDIARSARYAGESGYSFAKRLALATEGIIAYSDAPLWWSIKAGIFISAVSLLAAIAIAVFVVAGGHPVPGWASVIVSIYFLGGLIIANLGICGAYIGRIFEEVKNRPHYVVADAIGDFATPKHHYTRGDR